MDSIRERTGGHRRHPPRRTTRPVGTSPPVPAGTPPPVLAFLLAVTVLGLPLALSVLFVIWPAVAFMGYLVAAIWFGEWLLRAMGRTQPTERPYLAATIGLLILTVAGLVPPVTAIVSFFGLGAVTIAGWRTLTGGPTARHSLQPSAAPVPG